MTTLTFKNTTLSAINQNDQIWLTVTEIGKALGYSDPFKSVKNLYDRHQDEFTPNMTALINMRTNGGVQKVRIFSLRGCHLIGMLSHTKVAKEFRKWVLDILDEEIQRQNQPQQLGLPEPEKKYTFEFTEYELEQLTWLWFSNFKTHELLDDLIEPLQVLGSRFAPTICSHKTEYAYCIEASAETIYRLTKDFHDSRDTNWLTPLFYLRGELFRQEEMRKKHEAKVKKAGKNTPHIRDF